MPNNQAVFRNLLRLFLLGVLLVLACTFIEFCRHPSKVASRIAQCLRGELPPPHFREQETGGNDNMRDDNNNNNNEKTTFADNDNVMTEASLQWEADYYSARRFSPPIFNYTRLYSLSSHNGSFWPIDHGRLPGYNGNVIPHPTHNDSWIVVSQREQYFEEFDHSEEIACEAKFNHETRSLKCLYDAKALPIEHSVFGLCEFALSNANFRRGPRDARVFYGPEAVYILYGSQSKYICIGLWIRDLRTMLADFKWARGLKISAFKSSTELQRANITGPIEKNYFLFWDMAGKAYVHYNLWPRRSFAGLHDDGSKSQDLASKSADSDQRCIKALMPPVAQEDESLHQATNSLSITMCYRSDSNCVPSDENTLIMHIFHLKGYYHSHGVYEPFLVLFNRTSPFALHAISQKPFWVEGRNNLTQATDSIAFRYHPDLIPANHLEFFYITSMNWKTHGQKYHGFMDDEVLISFGIEDARSGTIDVRAADLLQDLAYCGSL